KNVPPYVLFSDVTLKELRRYFPGTRDDMLEIKGIGEKKYVQYGDKFLEAIQTWRNDNPDAKKGIQISSQRTVAKPKRTKDDRPSHMVSYHLFQSEKSIKEIAAIRDFSQPTIESHIFKAFKGGHPISWNIFFNDDEEVNILKAREEIDVPKL